MRSKLSGCLSLAYFGFMIVLVFAIWMGWSVYLDFKGVLLPAVVEDKSESISTDQLGGYDRTLSVRVKYQAGEYNLTEESTVRVDAITYDRLHKGDRVTIEYAPYIILPAVRLQGQTTLGLVPWEWVFKAALVAAGVYILYLWLKSSSNWYLLPLLLWGALAALVFLTPMFQQAVMRGTERTATAKVRSIHLITQIGGGSRSRPDHLVQPYQQVQLEFVPDGRQDAVVAVDAVDQGSVPDLAEGEMVKVVYLEQDPRTARILLGTRGYTWRNNTWIILAGLGGALLMAVVGVVKQYLINWIGRRWLSLPQQGSS